MTVHVRSRVMTPPAAGYSTTSNAVERMDGCDLGSGPGASGTYAI
jgi:hypothetical protein